MTVACTRLKSCPGSGLPSNRTYPEFSSVRPRLPLILANFRVLLVQQRPLITWSFKPFPNLHSRPPRPIRRAHALGVLRLDFTKDHCTVPCSYADTLFVYGHYNSRLAGDPAIDGGIPNLYLAALEHGKCARAGRHGTDSVSDCLGGVRPADHGVFRSYRGRERCFRVILWRPRTSLIDELVQSLHQQVAA